MIHPRIALEDRADGTARRAQLLDPFVARRLRETLGDRRRHPGCVVRREHRGATAAFESRIVEQIRDTEDFESDLREVRDERTEEEPLTIGASKRSIERHST